MHELNSTTKLCTVCKQSFPATLDFFLKHKLGRYGLHSWCRVCLKEKNAIRRLRPDQKERQKKWRDMNKQRSAEYMKKYRAEGYSSTKAVSEWRSKNIEHAREQARKRAERYRKTRPDYVIKARIQMRLRSMLKFAGKNKSKFTEQILGYTVIELRDHLEKQFTKDMTWQLFMSGEIHIDHIVPVSAFNIQSDDCPEMKRCWALTNLRPSWRLDNITKGAKREFLL